MPINIHKQVANEAPIPPYKSESGIVIIIFTIAIRKYTTLLNKELANKEIKNLFKLFLFIVFKILTFEKKFVLCHSERNKVERRI